MVDVDDGKIIDAGVRVFPEGVDNFDTNKEESKNEARRIARGMRRQIARRSRRKRHLRNALIAVGLFPSTAEEAERFLRSDPRYKSQLPNSVRDCWSLFFSLLNPYELRTRGLEEKLAPYEIGRVLIHLCQRRGFKSNKKEEAKAEAKAKRAKAREATNKKSGSDGEKKTEDILIEMKELDEAIEQSGARTLGEYLYRKSEMFDHDARQKDDYIRGRHPTRKRLVDEFDAIWTRQSKHHPGLLTKDLAFGRLGKKKEISRPVPKWSERRRGLEDVASFDLNELPDRDDFETKVRPDLNAFGLFGLIFFHRTLKPVPKEVVGLCELEPKEKRCPRAERHAQRFRMLQEVNNIRLIDGQSERPLNPQERALVLEKLSRVNEWTFESMKKELGRLPNSPPAEAIEINLEKGKRTKLYGMQTDYELSKALGKHWYQRPESEKNGIVRTLIHSVDDDETHDKLTGAFGLSDDEADKALAIDLTGKGYVNFSLRAIDRLMPFLERGMRLMANDETDSAIHAAGYARRDQLQRRLFDKLPDPARMNPADCPIGDIPNPVVKRALVEMRKVVNAIIREYGKPDEVHVEMGRDVKTRPKDPRSLAFRKYKEEEAARAKRTKLRDDAKAKLRENGFGYGAGGRNILKYLLWQEQGGDCIYSGNPISFTKLMSEEVQIDHILPYSQSLDDSPMNKVVCYGFENHPKTGKGQQTPRKWLEETDKEKYEKVLQRAKKLPYAKHRRFLQKEVDTDGCIARQLNDTRYIAKATTEFLRLLVEQPHDVVGLKGQLTSTLRRLWGLETVLSELPDSPAWAEQAQLRPGEKNRADHRHHAIDAVVVALTDRSRLQKLSRGFDVEEFEDKETGERELKNVYRGDHISIPWKGFRRDVIEQMRLIGGCDCGEVYRRGVSLRTQRKVSGALHLDSFYGLTNTPNVFVKRKPLAELSASEIEKIRDEGIKRIVVAQLREAGLEFGRGKNPDQGKMKGILSEITMDSGRPIKKVRLLVPEKTIEPVRKNQCDEAYVRPGSTHHLAIFEWLESGKSKCDAVFVTQLEAINRIKRQQDALSELIQQWRRDALSPQEIERCKRKAMSEIARRHPIIQRDPSQLDRDDRDRIPAHAQFKMSLSKDELVLIQIDNQDKLYVYDTAASTTRQMTFYPHTAAKHEGKQYGKLLKYPRSLLALNPRKVTVDPLGRIRWAND